jgi:SAM-dependent methyltransferase
MEGAVRELDADVGCGPGQVTAHLAGRGARVIDLDLSPAMCATGARATSLPFCAADMTALPIRSRTVAAIVSFYAVIHLGPAERAVAHREFARALRPGGSALIAFHAGDSDTRTGEVTTLTKWCGHDVALNFRFLDPAEELETLAAGEGRVGTAGGGRRLTTPTAGASIHARSDQRMRGGLCCPTGSQPDREAKSHQGDVGHHQRGGDNKPDDVNPLDVVAGFFRRAGCLCFLLVAGTTAHDAQRKR